MKQIAALIIGFGLAASPVAAQDQNGEVDEGFSLMEEGARMLMRGLMAEMEPAMEDLRGSLDELAPMLQDFAAEIGPAFTEMLSQVDDFSNYSAPEFLPNGDIIIRRKPDAPLWTPENDNGEIEL